MIFMLLNFSLLYGLNEEEVPLELAIYISIFNQPSLCRRGMFSLFSG